MDPECVRAGLRCPPHYHRSRAFWCSATVAFVSFLLVLCLLGLYLGIFFGTAYPAYKETSPFTPALCLVLSSTVVALDGCDGCLPEYTPVFRVDMFLSDNVTRHNISARKNDNDCADRYYRSSDVAQAYIALYPPGTNVSCFHYWDDSWRAFMEDAWCDENRPIGIILSSALIGMVMVAAMLACIFAMPCTCVMHKLVFQEDVVGRVDTPEFESGECSPSGEEYAEGMEMEMAGSHAEDSEDSEDSGDSKDSFYH